eukprot:1651999-Rhodomonas_salina.2
MFNWGEARAGVQLSLSSDALLLCLQVWGVAGDGAVQGLGSEGSTQGGSGLVYSSTDNLPSNWDNLFGWD